MSGEPTDRDAVLAGRLRLLATRIPGPPPSAEPVPVGVGSAILDEGSGRVVVLADGPGSASALGAALLLAAARGLQDIVALFDDPEQAGAAARRAAYLEPEPTVRLVDGADLVQVDPAPLPASVPATGPPEGFLELCRSAGLDPLCEGGTWRGEVLGLEVLRQSEAGIEVGVGRPDREAAAIMQGDLPTIVAAEAAAGAVRAQRHAGAGAHPLATLVRERWLRCDLVADPARIDLADLGEVDPVEAPAGLRNRAPAAAVGSGLAGERVLVVCSVGADPGLVPVAADLMARELPDRLVVALPDRDVMAPTVASVARLALPSEVVGLTPGWA